MTGVLFPAFPPVGDDKYAHFEEALRDPGVAAKVVNAYKAQPLLYAEERAFVRLLKSVHPL